MFSSIVVGTDGSADAKRAVRVAGVLAQADPATSVHVVTAFQPLTPSELRDLADSLPEELRPLLHGEMRADGIVDHARAVLTAMAVSATYDEVEGDPTDVILDAIDTYQADLAVVGSRGEGAAERLMHGSVSTKVLHHAPCAVLVMKST